jgi:excisionase family DNA binding protein
MLNDPILTTEMAARMLGVCAGTVRNMCKRGDIAHHVLALGNRNLYRLKQSDVQNYLLACNYQPKQQTGPKPSQED